MSTLPPFFVYYVDNRNTVAVDWAILFFKSRQLNGRGMEKIAASLRRVPHALNSRYTKKRKKSVCVLRMDAIRQKENSCVHTVKISR